MSDLRQQVQALAETWRVQAYRLDDDCLVTDDALHAKYLREYADELDALVRAASPPAAQLDHDVKAEVMSSESENSHSNRASGTAVAGAQHPAENTARRVDTDVVRGRVDGAAGPPCSASGAVRLPIRDV